MDQAMQQEWPEWLGWEVEKSLHCRARLAKTHVTIQAKKLSAYVDTAQPEAYYIT